MSKNYRFVGDGRQAIFVTIDGITVEWIGSRWCPTEKKYFTWRLARIDVDSEFPGPVDEFSITPAKFRKIFGDCELPVVLFASTAIVEYFTLEFRKSGGDVA